MKAIITVLLIVLSTSCFSLLFTNVVNCLTQQETTQAASVWDFDNGGFDKGGFWDVFKKVFFNISYASEETYNSYTDFEINSEDGFIAFAATVSAGYHFSGKTVTLNTDLDFSGRTFLPAGAKINADDNGNITSYQQTTNYFNGVFDGGSHTISNITLNQTWKNLSSFDGIGLFCLIGANTTTASSDEGQYKYSTCNCEIKNIHIDNMSVTEPSGSGASIGAIAGVMGVVYNSGYMYKNTVTIQNCAITNFNVTLQYDNYFSFCSGLVGISRVNDPQYCTAPIIKDCLVYSMSCTNQTASGNEVSALTPAFGYYYSTYYYQCPFFNIQNCLNYEDSVDSASLYLYPRWGDGNFSWHYTTIDLSSLSTWGDTISNYETLNGVFSGDQIENAIPFFDEDSFNNYDCYNSEITGGPEMIDDNDNPWFVACYYDEYCGEWYRANKLYLKSYLTEVSLGAINGSTTISTALVPKGSTPTEITLKKCYENELASITTVYSSELTLDESTTSSALCVDAYYIDAETNTFKIGTYSTSATSSAIPIKISLFDYCLATANSDIYEFQVWAINEKSYVAHFVDTSRTITFEAESNTDKTTSATYKIKIGSGISVRTSDTQCQFSFTDATGAKVTYTYTLNSTATTKYIAGYIVGSNMYNSTSSDRITISANTTLSARIETKSYNIGFG